MLKALKALGSNEVMLATADEDVCLVPASAAHSEARRIAAELSCSITIRNPISDALIGTVKAA